MKSPVSFTTKLDRFNSNIWHFHFVVPAKTAKKFIDGNNRRVICTLNNTETFQTALMHLGDGNFFINVNKKLRDKLKIKDGNDVHVSLQKDESEYGIPVPEELLELLKMDEEGDQLFHALTIGKQRTMLHFIAIPKNMDLRIRRAICVVEHLKSHHGKIVYKELMEAVKNSK
jgi:hypothetical protein